MKKRVVFLVALLGAGFGSVLTIVCARYFFGESERSYTSIVDRQKAQNSNNAWISGLQNLSLGRSPVGLNFVYAANTVRNAVVHIKTTYGKRSQRDSDLNGLFGGGDRYHDNLPFGIREASGSGVIVSDDGYIITNNHVIDEAAEVKVLLNDRRQYMAKVIGTDPNTDLALLKINALQLPYIRYGDSDSLQIGEWVLAVGNPFELTSTVTAGIVSAKARSINILQGRNGMAIESFIQTDAAVNPGNSGGALVNLEGDLIGINTAIASSTGSYSGYSFAIPVDLVKKVTDDLLKYGEVKRALLGVSIRDMDAQLAEREGIDGTNGVFVAAVGNNSAAYKAGIQAGDVILKINSNTVNSVSSLQEYIARYRPGDRVQVTLERGNRLETMQVVLKDVDGLEQVQKQKPRPILEVKALGAELQAAPSQLLTSLSLDQGVEVITLDVDGRFSEAGVEEGFIITHVDKRAVGQPGEVAKIAAGAKGGVLLEGLYPDGRRAYYAIGF